MTPARSALLSLALALGAPTVAAAQDSDLPLSMILNGGDEPADTEAASNPSVVRGIGVLGCAEYSELRTNDEASAEALARAWMQGYFSGKNLLLRFSGATFKDLSSVSIDDTVEQLNARCLNRPEARVWGAAERIWAEFADAAALKPVSGQESGQEADD